MLSKRGIPDYNSPIHLMLNDDHNVECYHGSWHIFYTKDLDEVTCPVCLDKLQKQGRIRSTAHG